ncbi:MAG: metallophosphoesterase family protein [Pseudolabrys sp.]
MFTLAHISDVHLAPLPKPRWSELIGKRVTGTINWQRNRRFVHDRAMLDKIVADVKRQAPDHIVITGDLNNIALEEEFARGRKWLQELGSLHDVSFVPGNHDAYVRQAVRYAPQWASYMAGDDGTAGFPYLRRRGPLALIGLSTAVPSAWGMAIGRLGEAQCARLGEMLAALAREPVFRVVLIHHPPVSQAKRHKLLTDAGQFLNAIAAQGAELVLHGHDHLHMLNWLPGPNGVRVPAVGVPSASARLGMSKNAAAYNLYAVDGAPGGWHCELISRGIGPDGEVAEQKRTMLLG